MPERKNIVQEPPVIDLGDFSFEESNYCRGNEHWMATTLLRECHRQGLEPFELPLAALDLSKLYFSVSSTDEFVWQMKRCLDSDYDHPIILDNLGQVADGNHRICKALLEGKRTILAYRLQSMPEADFIDNDKTESK